MKPRWEDLAARARGLGTHLLTRPALDALARSPDLDALADGLRRAGFPVEEGETAPAALELALRRAAARRLRIVARWCGPRAAVLTVLFEDEDRRSLRALVRGAVQGVEPAQRLAGLLPTPTLPERVLRELAGQVKPGAVAALLTAWRNPYGPVLFPAVTPEHPDLFQIEALLNRTFARRALAAARGTRRLVAYVRNAIDLENAAAAIVLAAEGKDVVPKDAFVPGGERLSIAAFEVAAAAGSADEAGRRLAASFTGSRIARALERSAGDPAALEAALLRTRLAELVRLMRTEPLGPVPLLAYALRLRAEMLDLRRIIWGVALGAPGAVLGEELVTA